MAKDTRDPATLDPSKDRVVVSTEDGVTVRDYVTHGGAHIAPFSDLPPGRDDSQYHDSATKVPRPGWIGNKKA